MSELETIPVHVLENYLLNHELEAEYLNRPNRFRRERGNSTISKKRFHASLRRDRETVRRDYFQELSEAIAGIEALEQKPAIREKTYEDVILGFGGRFCGESQVKPGRRMEILAQT